eukprot:CAMPEP_0114149010 /NCGR_PEP_ID=MMETSP0043_2-20121206/21929_1 /TAXON_ID=464988 /ORGANISM="Hemiselmis andersenii, Strain CCMP644" /LENGTH=267 /DNA_ID=CAMNT_0001243621 /DNA_START=103 /DNA_END=902 /DNA_ORIENTATION=-
MMHFGRATSCPEDDASHSPPSTPDRKDKPFRLTLDETIGAFRPMRRSSRKDSFEYPYPLKAGSAPNSPSSRPVDRRANVMGRVSDLNTRLPSSSSLHGLSPRAAFSLGDDLKQHPSKSASFDVSPSPRGRSFDIFTDNNTEPAGGRSVSPICRSRPPLCAALQAPQPTRDDEAFLQGRLPPIIPVQTYVAAFAELPQGARTTLRTCLTAWREGRMPLEQVTDFLRSVAWQAPTLNEWANANSSASGPAADDQLLSLEDLAALMGSAS